jgi:hypothetical protein
LRTTASSAPIRPIRSWSATDPSGNDPTGAKNPELLKLKSSNGHDNTIVNGIGRIGYMSGGKAARWADEDMADVLTRKAAAFIEKNKDGPFCLYFATHDIHVPRVPHARFAGTSRCGVRATSSSNWTGRSETSWRRSPGSSWRRIR